MELLRQTLSSKFAEKICLREKLYNARIAILITPTASVSLEVQPAKPYINVMIAENRSIILNVTKWNYRFRF
jgi:hypothetical protein